MEAITGIKEEDLKSLAIEIIDYADKISDILNKFDNKFYELESYYEGKSYEDLKSYYENIRNQYGIVKANIVSYSDDFIALIRKLSEGTDAVAKLIRQFEEDAKNKTKVINDQMESYK